MSVLKWRTRSGVFDAGDHFGDEQVGRAYGLTYHLDHNPHARVTVYFGVVAQLNNDGVGFRPDTRYGPTSEVVMERLNYQGDVVDEVHESNDDSFPFDYQLSTDAHEDVQVVVQRWEGTVWDLNDFWDGVDLHDN